MTVPLSPLRPSWLVLTTHPHRESLVIENLERQGFDAYCPMIVKRIRHARRTYDAPRPIFPGYVFAAYRDRLDQWRPILGTYGVRSLVRHGDSPCILPAGFVEGLRAREIGGVIQKPEQPFTVGQDVAVNGGPFDGLIGQIIEIRENDRVLLLLGLLNRQSKVQVDAKMLRTA
jgi:transcriptional antiterminator RfaH